MQNLDFKKRITNLLSQDLFSDDLYLNNQIINNLIRVRKENNISQKELARLCGLQQSNISRIENMKQCASIDELNRIFNKLGYKINISIERIMV